MEREQLEAAVVDLDMKLVDRFVTVEHPVDRRDVPADEALHGRPHALLGQAAHLEQPSLECFELLLEMAYDPLLHYPNLPVR